MKIKYVEIHNILSIENARLEFGDSGLILLDGWNYDDDSANGAGKTSIFNAISFGLYNKFPRKVSVSELLKRGSKSGYVKVGVDTGSELIEVARHRPNRVEFWVNGEASESMTQEEFEQKIGLSYTQYLISMYSSQTDGMKLISLNDSSKKDFFLQLMNLERFSQYKKYIDANIKVLKEDLSKIKTLITECTSKISVYEESIVDVAQLQAEIAKLDTSGLLKKLKEYRDIDPPDLSKYRDLEKKISARFRDLDKQDLEEQALRRAYASTKKKLDTLKAKPVELLNEVECPHCLKSFGFSDTGESTTLDEVKRVVANHISELEDELKQIVEAINSMPDTNSERSELNSILAAVHSKRGEEEAAYIKIKEDLNDIKSKINLRNVRIQQLQESIDKQSDIQQKITELNDVLEKASLKYKVISKQIEKQEIISAAVSPTGAPAYVMDSVIDVFNDRVLEYVGMLWPNASYSLRSFKENKSGDVKAKFSERLVIAGTDTSIGSLSGGEFRCLSLAIDFAIIDVIESMFGISINPIMMDEPFEGLDSSNRERAIDMFSKVAIRRQIWVIDHASEAKAMFTNVAKVEKRNGTSILVI